MASCSGKLIRSIHNNNDSDSDPYSVSKLFMSMVTDDLLWEILQRLPHAMFVIRCSPVSKRWRSLIHHPQFIPEFSRRIEGHNFELFFRIGGNGALGPVSVYRLYSEKESETNRLYPNLGNRQQWPDIKLRSSSLDLMVFKNRDANEIHICNPFTGQRVKISRPVPSLRNPYSCTGIVTDREHFGHFKVLVADQDAYPLLDIHVFCSRTQLWTRSTFSVPYSDFEVHNPIPNQGVLYFPLVDYESVIGVLVCSPLESSLFRLVQRPVEGFYERGRASCTKVFFGVVSGRLRVSQLLKRGKVFSLKIWELRYDDESEFKSNYSWVLVQDVILRSGNNDETKMFVVAFHPYDGDVIFVLRDYKYICRYRSIRGDTYEIIDQHPIWNHLPRRQIKHTLIDCVKAFTLIHTPWPTPLGPQT